MDPTTLEAAAATHLSHQVTSLQTLHGTDKFTSHLLSPGLAMISPSEYGRKLNHVVGWGMDGPVQPESLDTLHHLCQQRNTKLEIDLCSHAHPSASSLLTANGYSPNGSINVYAMSLPLAHSDPALASNDPIQITKVSHADLNTFITASIDGFRSEGRPPTLLHLLAQSAAHRTLSDTHLYLARLDGKVAASAGMAIVDGIALLYIDSVLPWARGKGIQRLLMRARLSDAVELGCRVAVVEARPGTASAVNAERVGFELAYVRTTYAHVGLGAAGAV
ncbi:GNAT family N-acetyltransferase [Aspergillus udagawae]|uniref:N-acetyltransferase domain-containing protein n=1 Tax=Aspergillus udagawae TaxID=91492 RepID=A0A8E0QMX5_9EURO|nr:uncharacterized protein Aud_001594 [Aspergillus udagawae]GIC85756.1 hypothetical protein Aud_001594 [Aspergillus udagawae]